MLLLAGCGGGAEQQAPDVQAIEGDGFAFAAPAGWTVARSSRAVTVSQGEGPTLVSVTALMLRRRYEPKLFRKVAEELDRVTADLAKRLGGRVAARRTLAVGGRKVRQYDVAYGRGGQRLVDRITYVLRGKSEYQLLCRWPAGEEAPAACAQLLGSFRTRS